MSQNGPLTLASVLSRVSSLVVVSACLPPSTLRLQRGINHKTGPAGFGLGLDQGPEKNRWRLSTEVIDAAFVFTCMSASHVHIPAQVHMGFMY